jgi:hypothetical protein
MNGRGRLGEIHFERRFAAGAEQPDAAGVQIGKM